MSERVVLDASAVLALLRGEPGAEAVARVVASASLSAVNLAEVLLVLERHGMPHDIARSHLAALALHVVEADEPVAAEAARISAAHRKHGLALGDCFCLATAASLGAPALTADRAWARFKTGVRVTVLK